MINLSQTGKIDFTDSTTGKLYLTAFLIKLNPQTFIISVGKKLIIIIVLPLFLFFKKVQS